MIFLYKWCILRFHVNLPGCGSGVTKLCDAYITYIIIISIYVNISGSFKRMCFFWNLDFQKRFAKRVSWQWCNAWCFRPGEIRPKSTVGPWSIFHEVEVRGNGLPIGVSLLSKGKNWVPLGGYPGSCSPNITPYCPIQPLYNPYIGGIRWYIYLGYSLKGTQLFPLILGMMKSSVMNPP